MKILAALIVLSFCARTEAMGRTPKGVSGREPGVIEAPNQGDSGDLGPRLGSAAKRGPHPPSPYPGPEPRDTAPVGAVQEPHAVGAGGTPATPGGSTTGPGRSSAEQSASDPGVAGSSTR